MTERGAGSGKWGGVERGMTVAGVMLAGCVATFAFVAVRDNDGIPTVHGVEHLALFARPSRALDNRIAAAAARASRDARAARGDDTPAVVDYAPTATIRTMPRRPAVLATFEDHVLVEGDTETVVLRPGASLHGVGRLEEIRLMRGQWVAIFVPEKSGDQSSR